jgi:hypothetical protein|tara:strand:- start:8955 stop:9101 length:147 start_codon:yes stop_codon:yes gene_type:complete
MILAILMLFLLIASIVHLIVIINKTKSELRYWIRKYLEISKLNNNKDE